MNEQIETIFDMLSDSNCSPDGIKDCKQIEL
jgi:hypothetical protein